MNSSSDIPQDLRALRKQLRKARRDLSITKRQHFDQNICQFLLQMSELEQPCHIAFYMAGDGEADIMQAALKLMQQGHKFYLPIIDPQGTNRMMFGQWQPDCAMKANRFDIPEPDTPLDQQLTAKELDLIFMPLVGFDTVGNRLGMGGGFYDRTLEFKIKNPQDDDPKLIGLAYQLQQQQQLPKEPWDVPLDGVITEDRIERFAR